MFERFTDTARRVTVLSQEEARNLKRRDGQPYKNWFGRIAKQVPLVVGFR